MKIFLYTLVGTADQRAHIRDSGAMDCLLSSYTTDSKGVDDACEERAREISLARIHLEKLLVIWNPVWAGGELAEHIVMGLGRLCESKDVENKGAKGDGTVSVCGLIFVASLN